jgi:Ser/Thr protein kinase RdoA (MazF antagonist)
VPALLGYDGGVLMLLEWLPGTSHIPREPDEQRLRAIGAAAARINAVALEPSEVLPVRDHPIADVDFVQIRREQGASRLLLDAEEVVVAGRPPAEPAVFVHGDLWHGNTLWDNGVLSAVLSSLRCQRRRT